MTSNQDSIQTMKAKLQDNLLSSTIIANRTIANYRLVEIRGTGGMANIYKAIQLSLDRPVALKIMHPHFHTNEAFIARFEKEAKRAAMLQHENIVSIIDYGCDNGEYYIAMEYIDGTNLSDIIRKQRKMPLEVALHVCHQVAEGLKYAHNMGLVHRDIKPGNIMLSYDGRVMITDFGIAKATGDLSITSTGQVIGSPSYMAPEQAAGRPTDHRSDLFSLGIIFYEILAGEKPFNGDTYQSLIASIMSNYPASLQDYRIDVTREIDELVQRALVKVTESRYQSAEEFSEAILAQLSKFKLQSTRKMMAEYLKNPVRTTERLRADKVSDHMESALYFLAVGEGKLAEAKREFLDVLRFDKSNKEAKKYLSKIEAQLPAERTQARSRENQLSLGASYAITIAAIIILSLIVFSLIPESNDQLNSSKLEVVDPLGAKPEPNIVIGYQPFPDHRGASAKDGKSSTDNNSSVAGPANQGNQTSDFISRQQRGSSIEQKVRVYDYPNQNIIRFATLKVVTNIPSKIKIDYDNYSWANGPQIKLIPGRHLIEASADGYKAQYKRVFLRTGQADTIRFDLATKKSRQ
jgi:serine/threonine-protein kinase